VGVDVGLLDDGEPLGRSSNITSHVIVRIMPKSEHHPGERIEIYEDINISLAAGQ